MIKINLADIESLKAARLAMPKPEISIKLIPSVKISAADSSWQEKDNQLVSRMINSHHVKQSRAEQRKDLLDQVWSEYNQLRIERAKVSNRIAPAVARGASQQELSELYAEIESFRPDLQRLFKTARYVQQYGELPAAKKENDPSTDILLLKDEKRKLVSNRSKLKAKIERGHLKESKVLEWQLEYDQLNAEYNEVEERLKKLEGK